MTRRNIDNSIFKLALKQHGAFTWNQAKDAGVSSATVTRRVASGSWERLASGIYVLTAMPDNWQRSFSAAQLSIDDSILPGASALQVHGLPGGRDGRPTLVIPAGSTTRSSLATIRRSEHVQWKTEDGFRVSMVEQAVLEVAGECNVELLERIIDSSLIDGKASLVRYRERLAALSGCRWPGIAKVRALVEARDDEFVIPESELERVLYKVLARAEVPEVERQLHPPWSVDDPRRFDAGSRAWRAIFEADGRPWHARYLAMETDRRRDLEAAANGWLPMRFTWNQLTTGAEESIELIRSAGSHRTQLPAA
jgi:hypothetical protein